MNGANLPVTGRPSGVPSLIAAARGPIIMITIGVLFLLQKFNIFRFDQTWPIILIVVGALALAGGSRRHLFRGTDATVDSDPTLYPPPPPPGVRR